jgi:hypothetical protein
MSNSSNAQPQSKKTITDNLAWGIGWGLGFAVLVSIIAGVRLFIGLGVYGLTLAARDEISARNPEELTWVLAVFPLYFAAGILGGIVVGLLRPLTKYMPGSVSVGMIVGTIVYATMGTLAIGMENEKFLSWINVSTSIICGVLVGGPVGYKFWKDESPLRKYRRRKRT